MDRAAHEAPSRVGLLGAGGQAREVASFLPPGTQTFCAVSSEYLDTVTQNMIDMCAPSPADRDHLTGVTPRSPLGAG